MSHTHLKKMCNERKRVRGLVGNNKRERERECVCVLKYLKQGASRHTEERERYTKSYTTNGQTENEDR